MQDIKAIIHKCEPPETGYWAEVPALPGCVTQGETLDEVRAMIADAVNGWFQCARDGGRDQASARSRRRGRAPATRTSPVCFAPLTGKTVMRKS